MRNKEYYIVGSVPKFDK